MKKIKVMFKTPDDIADFIMICSKFDCDINLYDGRNVIDAKSLIGVFAVAQCKVISVRAITEDKRISSLFADSMKKFEV